MEDNNYNPFEQENQLDDPVISVEPVEENQGVIPPAEPKKSAKHSGKAPIALVLILSLLASTLLGVGGGIFGYYFMHMRQTTTTPSVGGGSTSNDLQVNSDPIELSEESYTRAEVVQKVYSSVVEITTSSVNTSMFMPQQVLSGAGSGVIITTDGYIVTNHHVVDGASAIAVRLTNGQSYSAQLIASDAKTDLAVIKIEATNLNAATFGDSSKLVIGQTVLAIGNPLGSLGGTVTDGIISALDREITIEDQTMTLMQMVGGMMILGFTLWNEIVPDHSGRTQ